MIFFFLCSIGVWLGFLFVVGLPGLVQLLIIGTESAVLLCVTVLGSLDVEKLQTGMEN
jgi:hypothetical protein